MKEREVGDKYLVELDPIDILALLIGEQSEVETVGESILEQALGNDWSRKREEHIENLTKHYEGKSNV